MSQRMYRTDRKHGTTIVVLHHEKIIHFTNVELLEAERTRFCGDLKWFCILSVDCDYVNSAEGLSFTVDWITSEFNLNYDVIR